MPRPEVEEVLLLAGKLENKNSTITVTENNDGKIDPSASAYLPSGKYIPLTNLTNTDFVLNVVALGEEN